LGYDRTQELEVCHLQRDKQERSTVMGNVGKKDKGNKEQRKKPKLNIKEKRKQKNEKKNK
jgi:hypothetical protein